jgi:hypothetical protein
VEGLHEPLDARLRALLRRAVLDHATREHRRAHPPVLHIGRPGGRVARLPLDAYEPFDPGLCADVVAAMRSDTRTDTRSSELGEPLVWLTRTGDLHLQDVDARWLSAARAAYAEADARLVLVVVNRHGWRDPRSGLSRTWARLRPSAGSV